jgi:two-component system OmpR family sensor kinase
MTPSIRRQLLVWLLGSATLAVAAGAISTYLVARKEANALADYQLQQMALSFRDHALASGLIPHEDEPGQGPEVLVQIWNQAGVRLYLSHPRSGRELARGTLARLFGAGAQPRHPGGPAVLGA